MRRDPVRIENVQLPESYFAKEQIGVCLFQLRSLFTVDQGELVYLESSEERRRRIRSLLFNLASNKEQLPHLDIVVFPEYSSDDDELSSTIFDEFSKTNGKIVCACSYDTKAKQSVARIYIPWQKDPIIQNKLSESRYEAGFLSPLKEGDHAFKQFTWDYEGKPYALRFFLCIDFLQHGGDKDLFHNGPTINIVPMSSPATRPFHGLSDYLMRTPTGFYSTVTLLCNATATKQQSIGMRAGGDSAIIGPSYMDIPIIPMYEEAGLVCSLSVGNILERRTSLARPNYVISNVGRIPISPTAGIGPVQAIEETTYAVNPNVILKDMGYGKFYAFYSTYDYSALSDHIDQVFNEYRFPVGAHGVFGKHDILFTAYDIDKEFFTIRLKHYLGHRFDLLKAEEGRHPSEYFHVTAVLKFRGKVLPDYEILGEHYIRQNLEYLHRVAKGGMLSPTVTRDLLDNKAIIAVESSSDVTPTDREVGREEYLVLIFLLPPEGIEKATAIPAFRERVLKPLLRQDNVRTIEYCKETEVDAASTDGHYILHVVGNLAYLKTLIVTMIHKPLQGTGIRCGTRVIPPADNIVRDSYYVLSETFFSAKEIAAITARVVRHLKQPKELSPEKDPFLIRELPIETLKSITLLCAVHKNYVRALFSNPEIRAVLSEDTFDESLCKFIFAIMYGIRTSTRVTEAIQMFFDKYCGESFGGAMKQVEKLLNQERYKIRKIALSLPPPQRAAYEDKLGPELTATITANTSILGNLQRLIYQWNVKIAAPEHRTIDLQERKNFLDAINKLNLPIRMRNLLTHEYSEHAEDLQKTEARKFAGDLLYAAVLAFDFVKMVMGALVRGPLPDETN